MQYLLAYIMEERIAFKKYIMTVGFILKKKRYASLAMVFSFCLGILYWFVTMPHFLQHFDTVFATEPLIATGRIATIMAISIIGGINISLVIFRLKIKTRASCCSSMKRAGSGIFGGALSAFTPGCPMCTSLLSVALGTAGGLAALPFGGSELVIIALGAVTFSMFWLSRDIYKIMGMQWVTKTKL